MKISVIIPIYNIIDCLERCVMSVVNQTYRNLEIILIDDGSTDGTDKLVDELAKRDDRIRAFHKDNGGSSSARNLGISKATGEFIGFVDSDDYVEPDMFELLADAVQKYGTRMAQISRDEVNEDGSKRPDVCIPPEKEYLISPEQMMTELLMHRGDCSFCTRITAKELFADREFPVGELNEDFRLLTDMLVDVGDFPILEKQCYHVFYRMGSNSRRKDKNDFSRVFTDIVVNADRITKIVDEKYPQIRDIAFRFNMVQRIDYMLHIPISQMTRDNIFYRDVVRYIRRNIGQALGNQYLTGKNKLYLLLFAIAPKFVRTVHAKLRGTVALGVIFMMALICGCANQDSTPRLEISEETVTNYETALVQKGEIVSEVDIKCNYTNKEKINCSFDGEQGIISTINVIKGDQVKQGDILARLDVEKYEEAILEENHQIHMQQMQVQQLSDLRDFDLDVYEREFNYMNEEEKQNTNYGIEKHQIEKKYNRQIQDCEDAIAVHKMKVNEYNSKIQEGTIYAPADGVISICKNDKTGEYSVAGETLITMIRNEDMVFKSTDMELAQYIEAGKEYTITTGKGENKAQRTVVATDMDNWTDCMYFSLTAADLNLETGLQGDIWIELDRKQGVLYVPNEAVHSATDKSYVYTISDEGMREIVYVTTGIKGQSATEITGGLSENDVVIIN